jgi:hypothetical protein
MGGSVVQKGIPPANPGDIVMFDITPNPGWVVSEIIWNNVTVMQRCTMLYSDTVGPEEFVTSSTFYRSDGNTIIVQFKQLYKITAIAYNNGFNGGYLMEPGVTFVSEGCGRTFAILHFRPYEVKVNGVIFPNRPIGINYSYGQTAWGLDIFTIHFDVHSDILLEVTF